MIEVREERIVDAEAVRTMKGRAQTLMKDPNYHEDGYALQCFLEELDLWDEPEPIEMSEDEAVARYIREMMLRLSGIAQHHNISINIYARSEGYAHSRFGDYTCVKYEDGTELYGYEPLDCSASKWENVQPEEIRIGGAPKREKKMP